MEGGERGAGAPRDGGWRTRGGGRPGMEGGERGEGGAQGWRVENAGIFFLNSFLSYCLDFAFFAHSLVLIIFSHLR